MKRSILVDCSNCPWSAVIQESGINRQVCISPICPETEAGTGDAVAVPARKDEYDTKSL